MDELLTACNRGDLTKVKQLIARGVDIEQDWHGQPIHYASYAGHLDIVKLLVEHGASVNPVSPTSPLVTSLIGDQYHVAEYLLSKGAKSYGKCMSSVYMCCLRGNLKMLKLLLKHDHSIHGGPNDPCQPVTMPLPVRMAFYVFDLVRFASLHTLFGADIARDLFVECPRWSGGKQRG